MQEVAQLSQFDEELYKVREMFLHFLMGQFWLSSMPATVEVRSQVGLPYRGTVLAIMPATVEIRS